MGTVELSDISIEVFYDNEHNHVDIFILCNSKFVTDYQDRVYVEDICHTFNLTGNFDIENLLEFIFEPFKEIVINPIKMKKKHPEFYNFLVRCI